jgi:hypothetical protein
MSNVLIRDFPPALKAERISSPRCNLLWKLPHERRIRRVQ